jgi:uncharacterized membrane protein YjjP (DUF1212 family)
MSNQAKPEKSSHTDKQKSGEINYLLQKISSDEIDLEIDTKRDDEIRADRPPHHSKLFFILGLALRFHLFFYLRLTL